ncbi:MAG TPA: hypothetical protein VGI14_12970 [Casimicrobiaceae bacterium]|jgi:hypothetical protein
MSYVADLEARRQLLLQQCELDRIEIALAWHDLKRSVHLGDDTGDGPRQYPWLGRLLGYVIPLIGATRARKFSRYLSLGLLAYRIATGLRAR